ncbi:MAG: phosphodiester glycosidase family protein [Planctomycetota bacterium]|nr:phosphodiester glycosidase family protein [Planctomycetota bacterium]
MLAAPVYFLWPAPPPRPDNYDDDRDIHLHATPSDSDESASAQPADLAWKPVYLGIDLASIRAKQPRPLRIYVARIDLRAPGIRFLVTPPGPALTPTVKSMKASTFLARTGCQLAINTSPYAGVTDHEDKPQQVQGLSISEGKAYSQRNPYFGAMLITRDNHVSLVDPPYDVADAYNAAGGFRLALSNGEVVKSPDDNIHPRSAVGLSKDGRYLFLVAIDGRQPGWSEGVSLIELGGWMRRIGAWQALNFDGGGSTSMVLRAPDGKPTQVNTPVHRGIPGNERPSAAYLGVFAQPLP